MKTTSRGLTTAIIGAASAALLSGGCLGSTGPDRSADPSDAALSVLITEVAVSQQAVFQALSAGGIISPPYGAAASTASCIFSGSTGEFSCRPLVTPDGVISFAAIQLLDSGNLPQLHFDSTTTAVQLKTFGGGTVSLPITTTTGPMNAVQEFDNLSTITVTGIRSGSHRIDGSGTLGNTVTPAALPSYFIVTEVTASNLIVPAQPTLASYPISGTVTATVATLQGNTTTTATQVTTYDGTAIARTVITPSDGGPTQTCTYDLTKPAVAAVCSTP